MPGGLSAFRRVAAAHTLIPVAREVFADLETPLTAFWKLRRGRWSFLLESVEGGERWARYTSMGTEPRAVYSGFGKTLRIERPDGSVEERQVEDPLGWVADRFAGERLYQDPDLPRFSGGLVGAIAYDAVRQMEKLPDLHPDVGVPDFCWMETGLVLVWDNLAHRAVLVYLARVPAPEAADAAWSEAQAALDEAQARLAGPLPVLPAVEPGPSEGFVPSASDAEYCAAVEAARDFIGAGDVIQVVLSRRFTQKAAGVHPFLVYRALRPLNPSPYMFYLELGDTALVGASPEVLVRATDGTVETRPIAGTRPRGETTAADAAHAESLLADPKERAEHVMLVDLGRNDVGRVSEPGSVEVRDWMTVERYSHVMHLASHVSGTLRAGVGPADVIRATFPAGTLSGAPKVRAMELIEELESCRRGFYGGAVGMLSASGQLDLCITIRTLMARDGLFEVQAGAGIVYDSVPMTEADETRSKARAVLRAIERARELFGGSET
ncbi:MAG: anthranilate synthase component I family protein [Myxococcota bacterium]